MSFYLELGLYEVLRHRAGAALSEDVLEAAFAVNAWRQQRLRAHGVECRRKVRHARSRRAMALLSAGNMFHHGTPQFRKLTARQQLHALAPTPRQSLVSQLVVHCSLQAGTDASWWWTSGESLNQQLRHAPKELNSKCLPGLMVIVLWEKSKRFLTHERHSHN